MPHELKDFMKMQLVENSTSDAQFSIGKNKNDLSTSCFEKVTNNDLQKTGARLTNDMSQTICLFKKYLLAKSQHKIGKTNMEESEVIKGRSPSCPLVPPPNFGSNFPGPHSLLEQKIIPGIRYDATQASSDDKPSTAQLTIFYAGNVNVYDNIPIDKAQTIMLLAGENSLSKPTATEMPKTDVKNSLHRSNLASVCKLQQDLPIARKLSLRHFLEKRRCRIVNKCPYSPPGTKHKDSEPTTEDDSDGNNSISLSPFPSRLGFFFPVSAKKD